MFFLCLTLFTALLAYGVYRIVTSRIVGPKLSEILVLMKYRSSRGSPPERLALTIAHRIEPHLRVNEITRIKQEKTLAAAGIDMTPEKYQSVSIAKALLLFIVGLIFAPVSLLIPLIFLPICVFFYMKWQHRPAVIVKKRTGGIQKEVTKFAEAMDQDMNYKKDLLEMFRNYKRVAGPEMAVVLDEMITGMSTGNREKALLTVQRRVDEEHFSQVIQGLIGYDRGSEMKDSFDRLCASLNNWENTRIDAEVQKRPNELNFSSFLLLGAGALTLLAMILEEVFYLLTHMYS
jgi:tight adherence protein C